MTKKIIAVFTIVFSAVGIYYGSSVIAQGDANGFQVSPVLIEQVIEEGGSAQVEITAKNPAATDLSANVIANDFEAATDETGQPKVIFESDVTAPGNSFKALVGNIEPVNIPAGGEVKIPVTISIPQGSSPGGYYGAIRLEPTDVADKNVTLSASVGTLFLVTVPGDLTESLDFIELSAAKNESTGRFFFGSPEDLQIVTRLKNTGNIHVKPFGKVQIADSSGEIINQFEFNDTTPKSNVLPDSIRKFVDKIDYDNFVGKYTVTANLGYGSSGSLITAKNTFWVIPYWVLAIAIVALIAIIVGTFLVYRKLSKNRKHKVKPRR